MIVKLILPPSLVREARVCEKARLIENFWDEHDDSKEQIGPFDKSHIWKVAEDPETLAYKWHQRKSLPYTEVLGKLACFVTSKILGIGSAERSWKHVKLNRQEQRSHLGAEATKM